MQEVGYIEFESEEHLSGVCDLLREISWDNFHHDPDLTGKSLTAPGVTTFLAVSGSEVVGFAQVFGDGVGLQTHLSLLAVKDGWRRRGIAKRLVTMAFDTLECERMDLVASDESAAFYRSLKHREQVGFRLYPGEVMTSGRRY